MNPSYSFTHEPLRYYPPLDDEVTVGISVIAEHGDIVVMGTDMRATYPGLPAPHDECAKAWLTDKPIQCGVAVAGTLRIAQPFIDFLSFYFERAGKKKPIYREHVEYAIGMARYRTWREILDWEMKMSYGMSLGEWKSGKVPGQGKMNKFVLNAGKALINATDLNVSALIGGFVEGQLLFYKADGKRHLEAVSTPGVQVIGRGGALAMAHLNGREQTMACSFARSVLHVAEALDEARKEPTGTVGKPAWIFAIAKSGAAAYIEPDHPTLLGWKKAYRNRANTSSLQNCKISDIQAKGMTKPLAVRCVNSSV